MVPDQQRGGGYSVRAAAESNSIQHQATHSVPRRANSSKFYVTLKIIPVELIKGL